MRSLQGFYPIYAHEHFNMELLGPPCLSKTSCYAGNASHIILPKSPLRHWQEERYPQILVHPFFFFILVFFHDHSRITGLQGKRGGIFLTPHYHFHPFHRHFDISRAITAESSLLHIASSRNRTGNL